MSTTLVAAAVPREQRQASTYRDQHGSIFNNECVHFGSGALLFCLMMTQCGIMIIIAQLPLSLLRHGHREREKEGSGVYLHADNARYKTLAALRVLNYQHALCMYVRRRH
jgi:hypothetical protein